MAAHSALWKLNKNPNWLIAKTHSLCNATGKEMDICINMAPLVAKFILVVQKEFIKLR